MGDAADGVSATPLFFFIFIFSFDLLDESSRSEGGLGSIFLFLLGESSIPDLKLRIDSFFYSSSDL